MSCKPLYSKQLRWIFLIYKNLIWRFLLHHMKKLLVCSVCLVTESNFFKKALPSYHTRLHNGSRGSCMVEGVASMIEYFQKYFHDNACRQSGQYTAMEDITHMYNTMRSYLYDCWITILSCCQNISHEFLAWSQALRTYIRPFILIYTFSHY